MKVKKIIILLLTIILLQQISNPINANPENETAKGKLINITINDIPMEIFSFNYQGRNYIRQEDLFGILDRTKEKVGNATNWKEIETPYIIDTNIKPYERTIIIPEIKENTKENQAICTIKIQENQTIPIKLTYQYFKIIDENNQDHYYVKLTDIKTIQEEINQNLKKHTQKNYTINYDPQTKIVHIKKYNEEIKQEAKTNKQTQEKYKDEMKFLEKVNTERKQKNLPPYILSDKLMQISKKRVQDISDQEQLSHTNKDKKTCFEIAQEMGYTNQIYEALLYKGAQMDNFTNPQELYNQLIREKDTKTALNLNQDGFNEIGIAIKEKPKNQDITTYIVILIGKPTP